MRVERVHRSKIQKRLFKECDSKRNLKRKAHISQMREEEHYRASRQGGWKWHVWNPQATQWSWSAVWDGVHSERRCWTGQGTRSRGAPWAWWRGAEATQGVIGIHEGFQEGERCDHEIKVHFYKGHPVTVESGFKQAENGARKVLRKKSDHYRREMKRDGWWPQKWRGGPEPDPVYRRFTVYLALCQTLAHIVSLLLPITL